MALINSDLLKMIITYGIIINENDYHSLPQKVVLHMLSIFITLTVVSYAFVMKYVLNHVSSPSQTTK